MIRVFIGYDPKETVAYHVLVQSILKNASQPIAITPLALHTLKEIYNRPLNEKRSTDFTFSRFYIPYLCNYTGWALFLDSDMLFDADIAELWQLRDETKTVMVVKHDYTPKNGLKFLGNPQTNYPKKNWSSLMLLNCSKCKALDLNYLQSATGLMLHQFKWIESEASIGNLPITWNYLVGEYEPNADFKNLHFTLGGPYFKAYSTSDYAEQWHQTFLETIYCQDSAIQLT
jgi:lipopolysaccharide biosynthesis glycosyltransferase